MDIFLNNFLFSIIVGTNTGGNQNCCPDQYRGVYDTIKKIYKPIECVNIVHMRNNTNNTISNVLKNHVKFFVFYRTVFQN